MLYMARWCFVELQLLWKVVLSSSPLTVKDALFQLLLSFTACCNLTDLLKYLSYVPFGNKIACNNFSFCTLHIAIEVTAHPVWCFVAYDTSLYTSKIGLCELGFESCILYGKWKPVQLFSLHVFVHRCFMYLPVITR